MSKKEDDVSSVSLDQVSRSIYYSSIVWPCLTNYNQSEGAPAELSAVVDELLQQLQTKFSSISSDLLAKSTYVISAQPLTQANRNGSG